MELSLTEMGKLQEMQTGEEGAEWQVVEGMAWGWGSVGLTPGTWGTSLSAYLDASHLLVPFPWALWLRERCRLRGL